MFIVVVTLSIHFIDDGHPLHASLPDSGNVHCARTRSRALPAQAKNSRACGIVQLSGRNVQLLRYVFPAAVVPNCHDDQCFNSWCVFMCP